MSSRWLESVLSATSVPERDERLLRSFQELTKDHVQAYGRPHVERLIFDVQEQLLALADAAQAVALSGKTGAA